jgi:hypothetical protein
VSDLDELELIVNLLGGPRRARAIAEALALPHEGAPLPPSPEPPQGPRRGRRKREDEPRAEDYSTEHSYQSAHYKWRRANGIEGGSAPKPVTRPVTWGDGAVTRAARRPSLRVMNGDGAVTEKPSLPSPRVTGTPSRAPASEPSALWFSEETQSFTAAAVSGVSGTHTREVTSGDETNSGDGHPNDGSPVTRSASPERPSPGGGDGGGSKLVVLSPEAERLVALLRRESKNAIHGVLVGKAAGAFNALVEQLAGSIPDETWVRFARAARSGEAKAWWRKGYALSMLCNVESDARSLCYGITRGLDGAQQLLDRERSPRAPAVAQARPYEPGPAHVGVSAEQTRAMLERAGVFKRAAGGAS